MKRAAALLAVALLAGCDRGPPTIPAGPALDPILFFTGNSRGEAVLDQLLQPRRHVSVSSTGLPSGTGALLLLQRIAIDGQAPTNRSWLIRRVARGRYAARLSDADGPVAVDPVGSAIRIRYTLKAGGTAEQWLVPIGGGRAINNRLSISKWGIEVASLHEVIRKLD